MGIWPWNADMILSRAELNVRVNPENNQLIQNNYEGIVKMVTEIIDDKLKLKGRAAVEVKPTKEQVKSHFNQRFYVIISSMMEKAY